MAMNLKIYKPEKIGEIGELNALILGIFNLHSFLLYRLPLLVVRVATGQTLC